MNRTQGRGHVYAQTGILLFQLLVFIVLLTASCQRRNYVIDPAKLCNCDNLDVDNPCYNVGGPWQEAVNNLLEVSGYDFTKGDYVGPECQGEVGVAWDWPPFWFNAWRPVDGVKYTMSGRLHHFNWNYDDDEDWNMHVVPNPAFSFLIDDVEALHDESINDHLKCGGRPCMEAEISPDKLFWSNPWFFTPGDHPDDVDDNGYSWLEGRQLGFYGLWIMDANHDFKSEIHPSEMIWFKDHFEGQWGPFDIFWLLFMQDNTGRFDDRDNFDCDGPAPVGWEPWAQSPRSGQFNIAFEVNPATETVNFSIHELFNRFVVTSQDANARLDVDDGKSHALVYNGRTVVQVEEMQPNDNDLGIRFSNLCLRADGKLQGFVSIRSKIGGDDDKDEEGFHILYAVRDINTNRPTFPRPQVTYPRLLLTTKESTASLKGNRDHFTGTVEVNLHGNDSTTTEDYRITKIQYIHKNGQQDLPFRQNSDTKTATIENVPLLENGHLQVTTASGLQRKIAVPDLVFYPGIHEVIASHVPGDDALPFLSKAVGGLPGAHVPPGIKLQHLQQLTFSLVPGYAAKKNNELLTDKRSVLASELNQPILSNDQTKLRELFGTEEPFAITWTFEARNLETGAVVPVYMQEDRGEGGVQVTMFSARSRNDSLAVQFRVPGSEGIIELLARAHVTDSKGQEANAEWRSWSHGFLEEAATVENFTQLIQALTGKKGSALFHRPPKNTMGNRQAPDAQTRRASIVNSYTRASVRDKKITLEEIRRAIATLNKFEEKENK